MDIAMRTLSQPPYYWFLFAQVRHGVISSDLNSIHSSIRCAHNTVKVIRVRLRWSTVRCCIMSNDILFVHAVGEDDAWCLRHHCVVSCLILLLRSSKWRKILVSHGIKPNRMWSIAFPRMNFNLRIRRIYSIGSTLERKSSYFPSCECIHVVIISVHGGKREICVTILPSYNFLVSLFTYLFLRTLKSFHRSTKP